MSKVSRKRVSAIVQSKIYDRILNTVDKYNNNSS
jgi:hypothetical protein